MHFNRFFVSNALLILSILAMFCLLSQGQVVHAVSSTRIDRQPDTGVKITHGSLADCADAPAPNQDATTSLYFCSPKYEGKIEGAFSSQVVVLGRNFTSVPTHFYLTQSQTLPQGCLTTANEGCFKLSIPDNFFKNTNLLQFVFKFSWLFQATTIPARFYLIATYTQSTTQASVSVVTSLAFTLLSSVPPCITVTDQPENVHMPSSGCSTIRTLSIPAGKALFIQGYNWLPGGSQQNVLVRLECIRSTACSNKQQLQLLVTPDKTGFFQLEMSFLQDAVGSYQIIATNFASVGANSLAPQVLNFTLPLAFTIEKIDLHHNVAPKLAPFDTLPFISLLLALISFAIYFPVRRRLLPTQESSASLSFRKQKTNQPISDT